MAGGGAAMVDSAKCGPAIDAKRGRYMPSAAERKPRILSAGKLPNFPAGGFTAAGGWRGRADLLRRNTGTAGKRPIAGENDNTLRTPPRTHCETRRRAEASLARSTAAVSIDEISRAEKRRTHPEGRPIDGREPSRCGGTIGAQTGVRIYIRGARYPHPICGVHTYFPIT